MRNSQGKAIISSKQLIFALSQFSCCGSKPPIHSLGNSEYPTLHPNMAPATIALHVACPPFITSSVMTVLLMVKEIRYYSY